MSRRLMLYTLFVAAAVSSTGCCGRVRAFFYRLTHCPPGCCYPAYPYADGPLMPTAPAHGYGGPMFDAGVPGPVVAGGPGCASCYSSPVEPAGVPVVPYAPPMAGIPAAPPAGSTPLGPPMVYGIPQSAEPPVARPMPMK